LNTFKTSAPLAQEIPSGHPMTFLGLDWANEPKDDCAILLAECTTQHNQTHSLDLTSVRP